MKRKRGQTIVPWSLLLLGVLAGPSLLADPAPVEKLPDGVEIVRVEVFPPSIEIDRRFAYRQVLLTGFIASGEQIDLSRIAKIESSNEHVAYVTENAQVHAAGNGECEIRCTVVEKSGGEKTITIPVRVSGLDETFVASYIQDVQPILSRAGCTAGTCHGAQAGRNGFKLSLRGNDAVHDHMALTDELAGRRFNRAAPDRSLFLMKPSGGIPHEGGVLFDTEHDYYQILRSWVAEGVQLDAGAPRVQSLSIHPRDAVLPFAGVRQQMAVLATYSDGKVRDVTSEAFIETSNTEVTEVSRQGIVTAVRRGEAAIMARYEGRYAATQLIVMGDRSGWEWQEVPEHNYVDSLVYAKLRAIKSLPSELCTDAEFARRAYLDLTGLQPRVKEVEAFLLDRRDSRTKRDELVDRLIGSAEFVEFWTSKWSDLLQVNPKWLGDGGADALRDWIRGAVASNMPYNSFVRSVLTASGSTLQNPPAAYYKVLREPEAVMENTTQLFLGVRFNCNKCHDHPFERWTQKNYWELSAYFAQVRRQNAPGSPLMPELSATQTERPAYEELISDADTGDIQYPTGGTVSPAFPYQLVSFTQGDAALDDAGAEKQRREALASWITSKDNPYFAKSFVNRVWSYFFGIGIIDPVDDIRAGNPPSNPALLDKLTEDFIASNYDVRRLMRLICKSRVYSHSINTNVWNEDDTINFSHAYARRLGAETLFDAIHQATGSVARLPGLRPGARAAEGNPTTQIEDGFLDLFGRPPRESPCECERTSGMSLGQALNLVNGPTVANAVRDPQNDIAGLIAVERDPARIIEHLYLATLCRPPTDVEKQELLAAFDPYDPANAETLPPEKAQGLEASIAEWTQKQNIALWEPLEVQLLRSAGGAKLERREDGTILAGGERPEKDTYTLVASTDLQGITGFRLEVLPDDGLPNKGPGRADNGNFVLSELRVAAAPARDPGKATAVVLQNASESYAQNGLPAALAIDGNADQGGWAIGDRMGTAHHAVFETKEDVGAEGGTLLTFVLEQQFGAKHTIGKFRLWAARSPRPVRHSTLPTEVIAALLVPAPERTAEQKAAIFRQYMAGERDLRQAIRLGAAQDLAWALINSPAFLFNR